MWPLDDGNASIYHTKTMRKKNAFRCYLQTACDSMNFMLILTLFIMSPSVTYFRIEALIQISGSELVATLKYACARWNELEAKIHTISMSLLE